MIAELSTLRTVHEIALAITRLTGGARATTFSPVRFLSAPVHVSSVAVGGFLLGF